MIISLKMLLNEKCETARPMESAVQKRLVAFRGHHEQDEGAAE
jgi:hypothetical protein